jgi:hypothetical protein
MCHNYVTIPFLSRPHPAVPSLEVSEVSEVPMAANVPTNVLVHRVVPIPCPSGKHRSSIVTFRNHTVAAMFCIPCEHAWTEPTSHPKLQSIGLDSAR